MSNFPRISVKEISKIIKQLQLRYHRSSHCGPQYVCDCPSKLQSSEAWAHFTAQPLPSRGILGRMDSSSCPCFPMANPFSPIVCIWLSFIMAIVLRLPASAICLQTGDVKDLPKRTLQSPEITARADGRQVSAAGRDSLVFLVRSLIPPPDFPLGTWLRTPAHTRWDRLGLLITLSAWCTQNQETKPCWNSMPNIARFLLLLLLFMGFFFSLKGMLRQTENQGLSVPCWANPEGLWKGILKDFGKHFHVLKSIR